MATASQRRKPANRFACCGAISPLFWAIGLLCAFAIFPSGGASGERDVRVVLPLSGDGEAPAGNEYERIDPGAERAKRFGPDEICTLIAASADDNDLPRSYLARLIWTESRFDVNAVSPVGARGVAQFMPETAYRRGLRDPFDPEQAIPASAAYLSELRSDFGNLGLAAAAYNAGEDRVTRWVAGSSFLPLETENYVLSVLGKPADSFIGLKTDSEPAPLDEEKPFEEACRRLPVVRTGTAPLAEIPIPAWGAQVAGNFSRAVAMKTWIRLKSRYGSILGTVDPAVFRTRTPIGRRGVYAVQVGAASRDEADSICSRLRQAGGSCVVVKN